MKKYKVSLSFTCHEDWDQMVPSGHGRHCLACNKVVVDFTRMTDAEIMHHLMNQKNTCGRFYKSQLERPIIVYQPIKKNYWPAVAAMLVAGFISLAPIQAQPNKTVHKTMIKVDKEVRIIDTEPGQDGKVGFTIRLFKMNSTQKIYHGSVTIEGLGSFNANEEGNIIIQADPEKLPSKLSITIYAHGYEYKQITMLKKDIQQSASADIYLQEQMEMLGGVVEFEPQN